MHVDDDLIRRCADAARVASSTAEDYVLDLFEDRDLVLLGEPHGFAEHFRFLCRLLPRLYERGVYTVAYEFVGANRQDMVDRLVTAPAFDADVARDLVQDAIGADWGLHEYVDVLRAVWEHNAGLERHARPLRLLALNDSFVEDPFLWPRDADSDDAAARDDIQGLSALDAINIRWTEVLTQAVRRRREKALVYVGSNHSATNLLLRRTGLGLSLGNLLSGRLGDRVARVLLCPTVYVTVTDAVEAILAGSDLRNAGVPVRRSPFDDVPVMQERWCYPFDRHRCDGVTLADLCDGLIYFAPVRELSFVRPIDGFLDHRRQAMAQWHAQVDEPRAEPYSREELERRRRGEFDDYVIRNWAGRHGVRRPAHWPAPTDQAPQPS